MATLTGRAAIYTRVSLDRRDSGRSVTEQENDLRATCAREGWDVADVFVDNDRSASRYAKKTRPAYARLVDFVTNGRCDVVAVWELSRLSRDLGTLVTFRDLCRQSGVRWSVGGRTYDPGSDDDTWPLIAQAIQAEQESSRTSKRVRRAVTATAQAGRPHGRATYGYRREYDPDTRQLVAQVVDDDQAAVLREIADRFLAGEAFYTISRDLTARGVPTPATGARNAGTRWHPTNCARLMRNPAYVGRRMHNGVHVADAVWPAIFDDATWSQMQAKLNDPARRTRREAAIRHLLTGYAVCGACRSQRMATVKQRGGYRAYMCSECFGVARRQDVTDAHVEAKIIERLASPDLADLYGRRDRNAAHDLAVAREQAATLRARLAEFEAEAVAGRMSAAAFGRMEANLTQQIEQADAAAQAAALPSTVRHLAGINPERVQAIWEALTIVEKRDALRALGAVVTIRKSTTPNGSRGFDSASVTVEFPRSV